jgi:hypothetical protein
MIIRRDFNPFHLFNFAGVYAYEFVVTPARTCTRTAPRRIEKSDSEADKKFLVYYKSNFVFFSRLPACALILEGAPLLLGSRLLG